MSLESINNELIEMNQTLVYIAKACAAMALGAQGVGFTNDDVRVFRPSHLSVGEKKLISDGTHYIKDGKLVKK